MGGFAPFKCGTLSANNTSTLCLNGGRCSTETLSPNEQIELCKCPSGYRHDFTAGHFPNCGLPNHALALMFGALCAVYLASVCLEVSVYVLLRKSAQYALRIQLLLSTTSFLVFFVIWVEQGLYEAGIVFFVLRNIFSYRSLNEVSSALVAPIYELLQENNTPHKRLVRSGDIVNICGQLALGITLIVLCREANPNRFNSVVAVFFIFSSLTTALVPILIMKQVALLQRRLETHQGTEANSKITSFKKRLRGMKTLAILLIPVSAYKLVFSIGILSVGSLPGQYILLFILLLFVPFFTCFASLVLLFEKRDDLLPGIKPLGIPLLTQTNPEEGEEEKDVPTSSGKILGLGPKRLTSKLLKTKSRATVQEVEEVPVPSE